MYIIVSFHTESAKFSGEKNDKDMKFLKKLDTINDVPQHPRKKILPQSKDAKETVISKLFTIISYFMM